MHNELHCESAVDWTESGRVDRAEWGVLGALKNSCLPIAPPKLLGVRRAGGTNRCCIMKSPVVCALDLPISKSIVLDLDAIDFLAVPGLDEADGLG
jgi:hypothetical protein|mmetsp:Transcript_37443/g.58184  ORF Transcript_37443/g.58184 Transcript_37443/m.58184 type:complete len:96 (+) Transcript_37443:658-945(+)